MTCHLEEPGAGIQGFFHFVPPLDYDVVLVVSVGLLVFSLVVVVSRQDRLDDLFTGGLFGDARYPLLKTAYPERDLCAHSFRSASRIVPK